MTKVPCDGCTACCRGQIVPLTPEDTGIYDVVEERVPAGLPGAGRVMQRLRHQPNGDCVYLGISGCTIYERRPAVCRVFDCRRLLKGLGDRQQIRRLAQHDPVVEAGWKRRHTLKEEG